MSPTRLGRKPVEASERLSVQKRQLKADLEQVQRELKKVESLRSEHDIVAHIAGICAYYALYA